MSEEPVRPTAAQIREFIEYAARGYACPVCASRDFLLAMITDTEDEPYTHYQMVATVEPHQSFSAVPLVCSNCGHSTLFAGKVIKDAINAKRRPERR